MSLSAALHAAVRALRRPTDVLPLYLLGPAVPAVARVGVVAGLAVAYLHLELTGRLDAVMGELAGRELTPPDPEASEAFAAWAEGLVPVLEPLVTPTVVAAVVFGLLLTLLLAVLLAPIAAAGQHGACAGTLRGRPGVAAGVEAIGRHWAAFLAAYVLEAAIWLLATGGLLALVGVAAAVSPALLVLVVPVVGLGWLAAVIATRAVFAFVPVAIVVDGRGVAPAIRASAGFIRRSPVEAGGYYAIAVGTLVSVGTVAGVLALLRAEALLAPVVTLAVAPALDLVKTGLYLDDRGALSPPPASTASLRAEVAAGLRRGLAAVGRFARDEPALVALAAAVIALGGGMGWLAATPLVGALETSIAERLADHVPPLAAANFFGNNWTVAISTGMGGLALVVPSLLALWTNGVALGAVARLEVAPPTLLAFVAPHGVLELPALIVAGALGVHLGLLAWRTVRGRADRTVLADALERAYRVLVGLGVILAVAGLIEGFVSPYYWRPFLG